MRHEIRLPDLGLAAVQLSLWLVDQGRHVTVGDRIVEVLADGVTVDLNAPATGTLIEQRVAEDDPLAVGQILGIIDSSVDPVGA